MTYNQTQINLNEREEREIRRWGRDFNLKKREVAILKKLPTAQEVINSV